MAKWLSLEGPRSAREIPFDERGRERRQDGGKIRDGVGSAHGGRGGADAGDEGVDRLVHERRGGAAVAARGRTGSAGSPAPRRRGAELPAPAHGPHPRL